MTEPSNWRAATAPDLALLRDILAYIRDYYQHWGAWPTPEQIRAHLIGG